MTSLPPYVELHCHSGYSFLDGASHPEELILRAEELGYPALALTDHDGLYGAMEFARLARSRGIRPITGAEVTLDPGSLGVDVDLSGPRRRGGDAGDAPPPGPHLTLLAETPRGYANLCRLLSEAHLDAGARGEPRLPFPSLLDRSEGLIVLSGCRDGLLPRALEVGGEGVAERLARRLRDAVGPGSSFVELQWNAVKGDTPRVRALCALADRLELPVVATGDVHYHRRGRHRLQDVLVAIRHRTTLDGAHPFRRPNSEFFLASPETMARRFRERPDALASTRRIAERCAAFDLTEDLGYDFPDFEGGGNGEPAIRVLAEVCRCALEAKYPLPPDGRAGRTPGERRKDRERRAEAERRLSEELRLVEHHGLAGFFLVYRDIMNLAREVAADVRDGAPRASAGLPPGRGRGSSVSSIICYLIGLSHVDPVETDLFLGRFLNEALKSVPDIDLDFPREIREELILRIYERYGEEHAGLVCTFPTYRLRSAVREVGKALDLPRAELEKLAKLAEGGSAAAVRDELERLPEFAEKACTPPWEHLAERTEEIAGLPRHISQHVGGMIISSRPLVELVPLEPAAMEGRVLCQWDKDSADDAGFIKIDFLALGMLSLVEEAVDLIAERGTAGAGGEPVVGGAPDLSRIDFDDDDVWDRICSGDTVGLFQIESRAQIQMIRRVRPRNLEELAIQVAIVRPGPIVGGAVNPYVRRREMQRNDPGFEVPYDHPCLEEALEETLGVIIYQDQVLKVCRAMAGFTDGQAEGLRRAMSRRRSKEAIGRYWEAFRDGAARRGVAEATAKHVFEQILAFSQFGFPKSHAAAFGLLAYQSAWLRHYHPVEYYVALFNNQPMGFYALDALARDARRNGIEILLPDVNRSGVRCRPEGDDLRVGLGFVRGWGGEIAEEAVEERERGGPYRSLPNLLRRTPAALRRPAIENLIWVGGLDAFGLTRRELLWQAGLWLGPDAGAGRQRERSDTRQLRLGVETPGAERAFPELEASERILAEYRTLRFSPGPHPLALLRDDLPGGLVRSGRLPEIAEGTTVELAGLVVARQRPQTAKGYVFVLMEDEDGHLNVIVKPGIYDRDRAAVRMEPFLRVRGRLQKDGETINVLAHRVEALEVGRRFGEGRRGDGDDRRGAPDDPLELLTALRRSPPDARSFG